jgi:hypothetical protein
LGSRGLQIGVLPRLDSLAVPRRLWHYREDEIAPIFDFDQLAPTALNLESLV